MKNGTFVLDAHTGFWDASKENCKNRFGEAFIETFYAFHTGFNPPGKHWTMDYEKQFRKVDPSNGIPLSGVASHVDGAQTILWSSPFTRSVSS